MSRKYEQEDSKPRPVPAIPRDVPRCQHIKVNGTQCGSPALRGRRLCYYHDRLRRDFPHLPQGHGIVTAADLPFPDDPDAIQVILMRVIVALLEHRMDRKDAGLILYALQTATINLRTRQRPAWHEMVLATNPPETLEPEKIPHECQEEESLAALLMKQLQIEMETKSEKDGSNQQQIESSTPPSNTLPCIHASVVPDGPGVDDYGDHPLLCYIPEGKCPYDRKDTLLRDSVSHISLHRLRDCTGFRMVCAVGP